MTYSRRETAVIDRPTVVVVPNQAQAVGATTNLDPQHLVSAPLSPRKRKRVEDAFEDVRGFRRIRIYTSAFIQEFSILLATNMNVTAWRSGVGDTDGNRVSGRYVTRDEHVLGLSVSVMQYIGPY